MILKKPKEEIVNIWTAQENMVHFYKKVSLGSLVAVTFVLVFTVVAYFRDPIVVVRTGNVQEYYAIDRDDVIVNKKDVENFTRQYLRALYVWNSFDPEKLGQEIRPFSEKALVPKVLATQGEKFGKLGNKKISQDIAFVRVEVLQSKVVCTFLRILKVEGIPLIVPTRLSFTLIEGSRTVANPMGVYVAGIGERENAK